MCRYWREFGASSEVVNQSLGPGVVWREFLVICISQDSAVEENPSA